MIYVDLLKRIDDIEDALRQVQSYIAAVQYTHAADTPPEVFTALTNINNALGEVTKK